MPQTPRILVVDDAPETQLLARRALESGFEVVSAITLGEATRHLSQGDIDLVVLDIGLPDGDGVDFCRKISQSNQAAPPVILLTGRGELDDKLAGFSAGADDYVVKPFDPSELYARARLRLRRKLAAPLRAVLVDRPDGSLQFGDIAFDSAGDSVWIHSGDSTGKIRVQLTQREFRLLLCLARGGGNILSREQIITTVWDADAQITGRTVDTHICKLRRKISPSRFTIHSVYGAGYRFVAPAV